MLPMVHTPPPGLQSKDAFIDASDSKVDYMSDSYSEDVDGEMTIPFQNSNASRLGIGEFNTLDEPVLDTVMRDVKAVCVKFRYVMQPRRHESKMLLKEWDLWGPLLLCTFMAVVLQSSNDSPAMNDGGPQFAEVFVIVWVGSLVVTLNSKLLGGHMSIFQSVCVLGYCLLAPVTALCLCRVVLFLGRTPWLFIIRLLIALGAFVWSTASSMIFLGESQAPGRKALAGYPVCLFYALICWLIISHTD